MFAVKLKFHRSLANTKEGRILIRLAYDHRYTTISTRVLVRKKEWDDTNQCLIIREENPDRYQLLSRHQVYLDKCVRLVYECERSLRNRKKAFTVSDIAKLYRLRSDHVTMESFMLELIDQAAKQGRVRTSEAYNSALTRFMDFREGRDMIFQDMNAAMIADYEMYLKHRSLSPNSISFYMRILRAVYNRAVDRGLTLQAAPFRRTYTGTDRTVKRAVPKAVVSRIKQIDLRYGSTVDFARDMFMFSFYTRGMSFVDMAYLTRANLQHGVLSYRRKKTGQLLTIKWEPCMQAILNKYPSPPTGYLLPIICRTDVSERRQYRNALMLLNRKLKLLSARVGSRIPLSMYVARHSWASIAHSQHIPLAIISEGMGHDSEKTTQIYLASLEHNTIDRANRSVINGL